jgi:hypothetical protein
VTPQEARHSRLQPTQVVPRLGQRLAGMDAANDSGAGVGVRRRRLGRPQIEVGTVALVAGAFLRRDRGGQDEERRTRQMSHRRRSYTGRAARPPLVRPVRRWHTLDASRKGKEVRDDPHVRPPLGE